MPVPRLDLRTDGRCVAIPAHLDQRPRPGPSSAPTAPPNDTAWSGCRSGSPPTTFRRSRSGTGPSIGSCSAARTRERQRSPHRRELPRRRALPVRPREHPRYRERPEIEEYEAEIGPDGVVAPSVRVYQPDPYGTGVGATVSYIYRVPRPLTAYLEKESNGPRFSILLMILPHEAVQSTAWMIMAMNYGHDLLKASWSPGRTRSSRRISRSWSRSARSCSRSTSRPSCISEAIGPPSPTAPGSARSASRSGPPEPRVVGHSAQRDRELRSAHLLRHAGRRDRPPSDTGFPRCGRRPRIRCWRWSGPRRQPHARHQLRRHVPGHNPRLLAAERLLARDRRPALLPRPATIQAAVAAWGLDEFQSFDKLETQAYIAGNEKVLILAFRGTTALLDWITDANVDLVGSLPGPRRLRGGAGVRLAGHLELHQGAAQRPRPLGHRPQPRRGPRDARRRQAQARTRRGRQRPLHLRRAARRRQVRASSTSTSRRTPSGTSTIKTSSRASRCA